MRTGEGAESTPRQFLPIHARHFLGFCALSILTAGAGALVLGTWLLNYMNYYVFELARTGAHPLALALLGWHPWAVIRVVGYIVTGAALTPPGIGLWARLRRRRGRFEVPRNVLATGIGLVLLDIVVKTLLAPTWQRWLAALYRAP